MPRGPVPGRLGPTLRQGAAGPLPLARSAPGNEAYVAAEPRAPAEFPHADSPQERQSENPGFVLKTQTAAPTTRSTASATHPLGLSTLSPSTRCP